MQKLVNDNLDIFFSNLLFLQNMYLILAIMFYVFLSKNIVLERINGI